MPAPQQSLQQAADINSKKQCQTENRYDQRIGFQRNYFFLDFLAGLVLTFSFSAAPALNLTSVEAAILMDSPFAGLRPVLAALSEVSKVPKPMSCTLSFFAAFRTRQSQKT